MSRFRATAKLGAVLALGLACVILTACGSDSPEEDSQAESLVNAGRGFVGTVDGTDAFIALVTSGGEAAAYVCDGQDDIAAWFAGPTAETAIDLTNDTGARIEATASDGGYTGTVTLADGGRHRFKAEPAESGAGLLRVTGPAAQADGLVAGWIISNDGDQRGSLRVRGIARTAPAAPGATLTFGTTSYPVSVFLTPPANPATPPGVPIPYPNTGSVAVATR